MLSTLLTSSTRRSCKSLLGAMPWPAAIGSKGMGACITLCLPYNAHATQAMQSTSLVNRLDLVSNHMYIKECSSLNRESIET